MNPQNINIKNIPLLSGNPSDKSIIKPIDWIRLIEKTTNRKAPKLPKYCILSFKYTGIAEKIQEKYNPNVSFFFGKDRPIFLFKYKNVPVCFRQIHLGAPAAGLDLEEIIALGTEYIIFSGGVGALKPEIDRWKIILPIKAIRDEGLSYHYQLPSKYSTPSPLLLTTIEKILKEKNEKYLKGITWTTDAFYRETFEKREQFLKDGAICVDMEASALFAVAQYHKKHIAAIFYAGDLVTKKWDYRLEEQHETKKEETTQKILEYSLEALYLLAKKHNP